MSYLLRTTLPDDLADWLRKLADKEVRTEANMNEVLIREAKAHRELASLPIPRNPTRKAGAK